MAFRAERPDKVYSIVDGQMVNFRQLYFPLIADLPNVCFSDARFNRVGPWMHDMELNALLSQDMDPVKRGNMVRRLPRAFRHKLYTAYRDVFDMPAAEFEGLIKQGMDEDAFSRRIGGEFDRKIAGAGDVDRMVKGVVQKTVMWPTVSQSLKGVLTAGPTRSWRYVMEKREKGRQKAAQAAGAAGGVEAGKEEGQTEKVEVGEQNNEPASPSSSSGPSLSGSDQEHKADEKRAQQRR